MSSREMLSGIKINLHETDTSFVNSFFDEFRTTFPHCTAQVKDDDKRLTGIYFDIPLLINTLKRGNFKNGTINFFNPQQHSACAMVIVTDGLQCDIYAEPSPRLKHFQDIYPNTIEIPACESVPNPEFADQQKQAPFAYQDIERHQPCPYCGKTVQYIGMVGAPGCVDPHCDFWLYHKQEHDALCDALNYSTHK